MNLKLDDLLCFIMYTFVFICQIEDFSVYLLFPPSIYDIHARAVITALLMLIVLPD